MGPVDLIFYAAISYDKEIIFDYSNSKLDLRAVASVALYHLPRNHSLFSLSFEGYMIAFLKRGGFIYSVMCHELLGRSHVYKVLDTLCAEHQSKKKEDVQKKLKSIVSKYKGSIVPYRFLEVYADAPKAYMIKKEGDEDPDDLPFRKTPGRKSLQEELEELNDDKDDLVIAPPKPTPVSKTVPKEVSIPSSPIPKSFVSVGGVMLPPGFARHHAMDSVSGSNLPSEKSRISASTELPRFADRAYLEVEIPKYYTGTLTNAKKENKSPALTWTSRFYPAENASKNTRNNDASSSPSTSSAFSVPENLKKSPLRESNNPLAHSKPRPMFEINLDSAYNSLHSSHTNQPALDRSKSKSEEFCVLQENSSKSRVSATGEMPRPAWHGVRSGEMARVSPEESLQQQNPSKMRGKISNAAPSGLSWEKEISRLINSGPHAVQLNPARPSVDSKHSAYGDIASAPTTPNMRTSKPNKANSDFLTPQLESRSHHQQMRSSSSDDSPFIYCDNKKDKKKSNKLMPNFRRMVNYLLPRPKKDPSVLTKSPSFPTSVSASKRMPKMGPINNLTGPM